MEKMKEKLPAYKMRISRGLFLAFMCILFSGLAAVAQTRPVTGRVVAGSGDSALVGATVKVKGGNVTTVTGTDGSFTINAGPRATLIISSVGFTTQQVDVNNRSS